MYIPPSTNIKILSGVPLESNYQHTLYWSTLAAQTAYFTSKAKYSLPDQSYQRTGKSTMRVQLPVESLYDCNYLMFYNPPLATGNTGKWFYAFLIHAEYVNNQTTEITFQLDVMQTWFFEHSFSNRRVFVEREHSATDNVGDNLIPENLELGDYVFIQSTGASPYSQFKYLIPATFDIVPDPLEEGHYLFPDSSGYLYGGVYSPLTFHTFAEYEEVEHFIEAVTAANKIDGILGVYIVPQALMPAKNSTSPTTAGIHLPKPSSLGSYTPRNKKLLTHPYTFIYVSDAAGNVANFNFEYFADNTQHDCILDTNLGISGSPELIIFPRNYKGIDYNYDNNMITQNCPQLPFICDNYLAWSALKANTWGYNVGIAGGITQEVASVAKGTANQFFSVVNGILNPKRAINSAQSIINTGIDMAENRVNTIDKIAMTIAAKKDAKSAPDQMRGNQSSTVLYANNGMGFRIYNAHIRTEFAQIIDEYFDMYGYATNRVKVPNRSIRPHWNYIKTINCTITGTLPADDEKEICDIYDNGITFWKNPTEVGNYSLDNSPT